MITVKDLSPDQKVVYNDILLWTKVGPEPVLTVGGVAGSGKSSLLGIIGSLPQFQPIAFCTYTGKASSVLRKKLGIATRNFTCTENAGDPDQSYCGTIHKLIYAPVVVNNVVVDWELRQELDADYKLIVIDEASMVNDDMLIELRGFGIPILAVGDHGQLPPVSGHGSLMENPMLRLEKIHRQAEGNPIIALSKTIRETGKFDYQQSEFIKYGKLFQLGKILERRYGAPQVDLNKLVTICYTNSRRVHSNSLTRNILKRPGPPSAREQIVCLKNIKGTSIYNGMRGLIQKMNGRDTKFPWQMLATVDFVEDDVPDQQVNMCVAQFGYDKTLDFEKFAERLMQIAKKDVQIYSWSQVGHLFDFGYAMTAHKCVDPETIVETDAGLIAAKDLNKSGWIATPDGRAKYKNFVHNRTSKMLEIETRDGYLLRVTPDHGVDVWDAVAGEYVRKAAKDIQYKDYLRLRLEPEFEGCDNAVLPTIARSKIDVLAVKYPLPTTLDDILAEFLGLFVADGCVWKTGFRLAKRHIDVVDRFDFLVRKLFGESVRIRRYHTNNAFHSEIRSSYLAMWLRSIDGLRPNDKAIPQMIMGATAPIQHAFLRGLFEDGTVNIKDGWLDHIEFTSTYPNMLRRVRLLLLRAGIICGHTARKPMSIYIYGVNAKRFAAKIGFISAFKNDRLRDGIVGGEVRYHIPVTRAECERFRHDFNLDGATFAHAKSVGCMTRALAGRLLKLFAGHVPDIWRDRMRFHHSRVKSIIPYLGESVCVEVPKGHRFIQDGFVGWNCQGSSFEDVLLIAEKPSRVDEETWRKWCYTSCTRSSSTLTILT